jgi:mgtE-like transporter
LGTADIRQLSLTKTTSQSLLSLIFGLGGIFAGSIVAFSLGLFSREPWIIALYPGILSMRGVIGGLFSGRLSTGLHLGTIEANIFGEKTESLRLLQSSIILLTFESSIVLGFTALLFGALFWGINVFSVLAIFGTLIATMALSIVVISPITIAVAFFSVKKGLDPDITVYPITAVAADILVTLCYVLVLSLSLTKGGIGQFIVLIICVAFAWFAAILTYRNRKRIQFARAIKEAFFTLIIVAFIVNITGSVLSRIGEVVGYRPGIYVIYPALLNIIGSVGAIVGSTATTKLALGSLVPSLKSIKNHRNQIIGVWIASFMMYLILALISSLYEGSVSSFVFLRFVALLSVTNISAAIIMIIISFSVAIITFYEGLDPDNFVIPIESSLADAITTVSLLVMLSIIGGL